MSVETIHEEAFNLLCGDLIGEGESRRVFECKIRPDLVVKVEEADFRIFANVIEQKLFDDTKDIQAISKWLAPCEFLSPDGRILLQRKCDPVPSSFKLPDKVPEFLGDLKRENFGVLGKKLVCVDYGIYFSTISTKLVKAGW